MKRISAIVFFLLLMLLQAQAQQLVQERLYFANASNKSLNNSSSTKEGNVIYGGSYVVNNKNESRILLVKPNTDTVWVKKGPILLIGSMPVRQAPSGGYMMYSTRAQSNLSGTASVLQRFDKDGNMLWANQQNLSQWERGFHLLNSFSDKGYFVGGETEIAGKRGFFTLGRTDSLGNLKWVKKYDWDTDEFLANINHTRDGNIIMFGSTNAGSRIKLVKVNLQGDSLVGNTLNILNTTRREVPYGASNTITPLSDGGYLITAEVDTFTSSSNNPAALGMVVKVNANLQRVWHYINHQVPKNVFFSESRELQDGTLLVLAYTRNGATSRRNNEFFFYRFSAAGTLLNVYTFTSSLATQMEAITLNELSDSTFMIGGKGLVTTSPLVVGYYVAKVKINGLPPVVAPLIINSTKEEFIVGTYGLGQSYPNPAQETAIIPYTLPLGTKQSQIIIRDVTGREIKSYNIKPNSSSLEINLSNLPNGLYTYTLVVDEKPISTKKLAVLK